MLKVQNSYYRFFQVVGTFCIRDWNYNRPYNGLVWWQRLPLDNIDSNSLYDLLHLRCILCLIIFCSAVTPGVHVGWMVSVA
jgi:hypothetical protein